MRFWNVLGAALGPKSHRGSSKFGPWGHPKTLPKTMSPCSVFAPSRSKKRSKNASATQPWFFDAFWLLFGSTLAPFGLPFAPFGLLFGSLWLPIGSLLITFALFGTPRPRQSHKKTHPRRKVDFSSILGAILMISWWFWHAFLLFFFAFTHFWLHFCSLLLFFTIFLKFVRFSFTATDSARHPQTIRRDSWLARSNFPRPGAGILP